MRRRFMVVGTSRLALILASAALAACGDSAGASSVAGDGGAGGDPLGGAGPGGFGGEGVGPDPLLVAVLAESGPGNEPAMVRFFNDTASDLLNLALPDGQVFAFIEVPAGITTPYVPKALVGLQGGVEVGVCNTGICVTWPLDELVGASDLMPGLAYTLRVEDTAANEFLLEVIEDAPPAAFVGARVLVQAPGSGPPDKAVQLRLSLDGAEELTFEDAYDTSYPSQYLAVADDRLSITGLEFRDRANQVFVSDEAQTLEGSLGYTLVVTTQPIEGAVFTATLQPQP